MRVSIRVDGDCSAFNRALVYSSCVALTRWFMRGYSLVRRVGILGWLVDYFTAPRRSGDVIVIHWLVIGQS